MYSVFNSNITIHLDSFWQMKLAFLINSANKNIYSFVSHITVSIIPVKYDLLLRDKYGFRTGYFSYNAERSEEWTSPGRQLHYQRHWPRMSSHGDGAEEQDLETRSREEIFWLTMGALLETKWCQERISRLWMGPNWDFSPFFPTSLNHVTFKNKPKLSAAFNSPDTLTLLTIFVYNPPHSLL